VTALLEYFDLCYAKKGLMAPPLFTASAKSSEVPVCSKKEGLMKMYPLLVEKRSVYMQSSNMIFQCG